MRGAKLGIILVVLLFAAGCVEMMLMSLGGAAAIGSYKWMEGTMEKDYPRSMQDTWNAALAACKDMKLQIQTQNFTPTECEDRGGGAAGHQRQDSVGGPAQPDHHRQGALRPDGQPGRLGLLPPTDSAPPGPAADLIIWGKRERVKRGKGIKAIWWHRLSSLCE